jgi:hypothetical protein
MQPANPSVMRVLVATTAGPGHFAALAPFAAAVRNAGHAVRVAAPASFQAEVHKAGFEHAALADPPSDEIGPLFARLPGLPMDEANAVVVRDVLAASMRARRSQRCRRPSSPGSPT